MMKPPADLDSALETASERMAAAKGIATLYKFRRCCDATTFGNLTKLLQGELWFSPLAEFNDPFEGRPCYVPAHSDPEKQRRAMVEAAENFGLLHNIPSNVRAIARERAKTFGQPFTGEHAAGIRSVLAKDMFVYCFSASRTHPLQWTHYADEHKGVCVHFDAKEMPVAAAMRVDYSDTYPALRQPPLPHDTSDNFVRCTLTKASWWSYESEYRLVSMRPPTPQLEAAWPFRNRAIRCPPQIISGITLGARMPIEWREKVLSWCRAMRPDVQAQAASLHDSEYKLEFFPVTLPS